MSARSRLSGDHGEHPAVVAFASLQWLGFMFANTAVIPVSIGSALHLSGAAISGMMARSFLVTGLACLAQAFVGHRLPIMEGQSGLWWGVILGLTNIGLSRGMSASVVGGSMAIGIVCGGLLVAFSGLFGLYRFLNRLFTPIVMAVLLILLASQLVDIFFRGMLGLDANGRLTPGVAGLAFAVFLLVAVLTIAGRGLLSNFSILIGLAVGWIAYTLLIHAPSPAVVPSLGDMAELFAWGRPAWNAGLVMATVVTALINTTNTIASLRASEPVFDRRVNEAQYRRSFVITGLFTAASGPLALVPYAPYTSAIGFLRTTRLLSRAPFIVGAGLFAALGLIPPLAGFFSKLPISIGDAVLLVAYFQLFGSALHNLEGMSFDFHTVFRIAAPSLLGLAILSLPARTFQSLPGFVQAFCANGMLVGILLAVILENAVPWGRLAARD